MERPLQSAERAAQFGGFDQAASGPGGLGRKWPSDADFLTAVIETQNGIAAAELDSATVMQLIVDRTRTLAGADGAAIERAEGDRMVCRAASGTLAARVGLRLAVASSLSGRCAMTGEPICCDDVQADPRADRTACRRLGVRSLILVPLPHDGRVVGVLKVVANRPAAFDRPAAHGLRLMAGLLASALSHAAAFDAKRRLLADRDAAADALRVENDALRIENDALRAAAEEYRAMFEQAGVGKAQTDLAAGRLVRVNRKLCDMLGYTADELAGMTFLQITHPDDQAASREVGRRMLAGEVADFTSEKRFVRKDGRVVWAGLNSAVLHDAAGRPVGAVATIQDVTDRKRAECLEDDRRRVLEMVARDLPLPEVLGRLAAAVELQIDGAAAAVMALHDGTVRLHGPGLPAGWRAAVGRRCLPLAVALAAGLPAGAWASAADTRAADGGPTGGATGGGTACGVSYLRSDPAWADLRQAADADGLAACWAVGVRAADGAPLGLLAVFHRDARPPTPAEARTLDLAGKLAGICVEHHHTTRQLAHLVRHDRLTGLPNRICFEDRLGQALAMARRAGRMVGVVALDVDHFKRVNDTLGHDAGDALLQQFAARLVGRLRATDTMARMGGDEFMIVLADLAGPDGAAAAADKLLGALRDPFAVGGQDLRVTSSMGIALFPADGAESAALQRRADEQMYVAKRRGRNGYAMNRDAPGTAATPDGRAATPRGQVVTPAGQPEDCHPPVDTTAVSVDALLASSPPPEGAGGWPGITP